jgi:SAM-dependent methyltransferase
MSQFAELYGSRFYGGQRHSSYQAAEAMLPVVLDRLHPTSVVDVGCGVGTWLGAALHLGIPRAVGVDGPWVERDKLQNPAIEFVTHNLEATLPLAERFDLAMSLEVAEHLTPGRAESFVRELCGLSDCVLFGAAIPGQGGINHIHERWQEFWQEIFARNGYRCLDIVRPTFWDRAELPVHYRQNTFLYIRESRDDLLALFADQGDSTSTPWPTNLVHPEVFLSAREELDRHPTLGEALHTTSRLPLYVARSIKKRLGMDVEPRRGGS